MMEGYWISVEFETHEDAARFSRILVECDFEDIVQQPSILQFVSKTRLGEPRVNKFLVDVTLKMLFGSDKCKGWSIRFL